MGPPYQHSPHPWRVGKEGAGVVNSAMEEWVEEMGRGLMW